MDYLGFCYVVYYSPFGLNLAGIEKQGQPDDKFQYNSKEKQEEFGLNLNDYGARNFDPQLGRFHNQDRFAEKYYDLTPYQYGANNPIINIDINGDSVQTFFYDKERRKLNTIPEVVQKMFNDEYGVKVGYNSETNMLYYVGETETSNTVSESAKEIITNALKDEATGKEAVKKYGEITFGYNISTVKAVDWGQTQGFRHSYIDLADFKADGTLKGFNYSKLVNYGYSTRTFNMARVFEHEWIGHNVNNLRDGLLVNTKPGGVERLMNKFRAEMNLPARLNYGGLNGIGIFFHYNTSKDNFRQLRKTARQTQTGPYLSN